MKWQNGWDVRGEWKKNAGKGARRLRTGVETGWTGGWPEERTLFQEPAGMPGTAQTAGISQRNPENPSWKFSQGRSQGPDGWVSGNRYLCFQAGPGCPGGLERSEPRLPAWHREIRRPSLPFTWWHRGGRIRRKAGLKEANLRQNSSCQPGLLPESRPGKLVQPATSADRTARTAGRAAVPFQRNRSAPLGSGADSRRSSVRSEPEQPGLPVRMAISAGEGARNRRSAFWSRNRGQGQMVRSHPGRLFLSIRRSAGVCGAARSARIQPSSEKNVRIPKEPEQSSEADSRPGGPVGIWTPGASGTGSYGKSEIQSFADAIVHSNGTRFVSGTAFRAGPGRNGTRSGWKTGWS